MKQVFIGLIFILSVLLVVDQFIVKSGKNNTSITNSEEDAGAQSLLDSEQSVEAVADYGLQIGQAAPDFTLETLDGTTLSLKDLRGKKVLLNFWASWCGPCKEEMPHMQKVYEQIKDEDTIEIVAINLTIGKESAEDAAKFVREMGLSFPIPLDIGGKVQEAYEIYPIPTSYFIDANGVIQSKYLGPMNEEYIMNELNKL
ncbi:TlpA family protein disulfide reductase [Caldibacillus lycopersici]|uniref:TlpA family protein disulfide reductase n=1 Tax=Perspicuibacillus lycopersici TaxID=1325689 RepID=A0AAE3IX06_9BACI|nr:TlpA disulfide reductase family protein [Perspicuibacillus lycopersici]MCU9613605.1 TlpA family protein disulfide reductase [Perspicuibacillus lycopersici]